MKKKIEIYKLNRQINHLNRQMVQEIGNDTVMVAGGLYPMPSNRYHSSEKANILRESVNRLIDQRNELRGA